jgi:hypothetical protein
LFGGHRQSKVLFATLPSEEGKLSCVSPRTAEKMGEEKAEGMMDGGKQLIPLGGRGWGGLPPDWLAKMILSGHLLIMNVPGSWQIEQRFG